MIHSRARSLADILLVCYVFALVMLPSWAGISFLGIVMTPARALLAILIPVGLYATVRWSAVQPTLLVASWIAFLGASTVTTVLHFDPRSLARLLSIVVEGGLLFWVARALLADGVVRQRVIVALVLATTAAAVISVALIIAGTQYNDGLAQLFGRSVVPVTERERFGLLRIEGPFGQPLVFGTWLVGSLPLSLGLVRSGRGALRNWAPVVGVGASATAIILTVSRSPLIVASFIPAAYAWSVGRRWATLPLTAIALSVSAAVILLSGTVSLSPAESPTAAPGASAAFTHIPVPSVIATPNPVRQSGELRAEAYRNAAKAILQQPVFGHGLLKGADALGAVTGHPNYVDNTYLQVAIEQGLVGLGSLLVLLGAVVKTAVQRRHAPAGLSVLLAVITLLVMCVVVSFFSFTQSYALFWLVAAVATAPFNPQALPEAASS